MLKFISKSLFWRGFLALILFSALCFLGAAWYLQQHLQQPLQLKEDMILEVNTGRSYLSLVRQLEEQGLLKNAWLSRVWLKLQPQQAKIHTGEYLLQAPLSLRELNAKLQQGAVITYKITFVEGSTLQDMRLKLAQAPKLEQLTANWSEAELMQELGQPNQAGEGWFFPSTYTYSKGMRDLDILRQANRKMRNLLEEAWQERPEGLPYKNKYEVLVMASIVEKETGAAFERPAIAGVFVRRLQKNMRLQTDPTVIYGMQENYTGRITRKDLLKNTPWNTYTNHGLPPTPIALPSGAAIKASLNPEAGTALYFVAKGDGTHKFSSSLEEHNQAVRKYQLQRRQDYRSSPAPSAP